MKTRIKAILFDFGGVISRCQNKQAVTAMCRLVNLPEDTFIKTYRQFRPDYDSAIITGEEYWDKVLDHHDKRISADIELTENYEFN